MVKILYGVCSEGMGHATRSSVDIEYLIEKGHEVHIMTSGRAYDFLKKRFPHVHEIQGYGLKYEDDKLLNFGSMIEVIKQTPKKFVPSVKRIVEEIKHINPEIVVTDHEFFTALVGNVLRIPVIGTSNISVVDKTEIDKRGIALWFSKFFTVTSERLSNLSADHYVIPTFFYPPVKKKTVHLVAPVVRKEVTNLKVKKRKHILVYHTTKTNKTLLRALEKVDEQFVVYGFGKRKKKGNLTFHDFGDHTFLQHLASCKAVITGGGFSLMSEALYLKKPILSVPLRQHFEQLTNAYYLRKKKYGDYVISPTAVDIQDFMLKLPFYEHYLNQYNFDPAEHCKKIEQLVRKARLKNKRYQ